MRQRAHPAHQMRRCLWLCATVTVALLTGSLSVLTSALAAAPAAAEYAHDGWSGTVDVTVEDDLGGGNVCYQQATFIVDGRHNADDDVADGFGTWLEPKRVIANYRCVAVNSCPGGGNKVTTGELDTTEESEEGYFDVTWQDGQHHITALSTTSFPIGSNCGGDNETLAVSFGVQEEHPPGEPAPEDLVGEKTESGNGNTTTWRWNLTRNPAPDDCLDRRFSTADGVAAYNVAAAPDPDFAWFGLSMAWCLGPDGAFVLHGDISQADLSSNWFFLAALEELGFKPFKTEPQITVSDEHVRGKAIFGVRTSPLSTILSLVPTGRLLNSAAKGLAKYRAWVKLGMSHDKARDKLDDYIRSHVRRWNNRLDTLIFTALDAVPGISRNTALAWTGIMSKVFEDVGAAFSRKLVKKLIGGKAQTKRAFKSVFARVDIGLWKVNATLTVDDGGTATFTNRSKTLIVFDEWEHKTVT